MADAAVEFLLENLKQLLLYNAGLVGDIKDQVEFLYKEISLFKAFLKDSADRRHKHETLKEIVKQIREVVYEAEDAIDEFVYHAAVHRARKGIEKALHAFDHPAKLRNIAKTIEGIRLKVKDIYEKKKFGFEGLHAAGDARDGGISAKKPPIVEEDNVVGFQDEADKVINLLTEGGSDELEVVSIVGMPGLGKTTLAKMIYRDPRIEYEFYNRAWAYVSQDYSRKEVYLSLLSSLNLPEDSMHKMTEEGVAKELNKTLEKGKYFVVIDDVWSEKAWNDIKSAFPKNKMGSRILLTSRINTVAKRANPNIEPHNLRFLTSEESWTLLQKKALGSSENCPPELVRYGKHISKECGGLPLAIVVIGGILLEKGTDRWEQVANCVDAYITMDQEKRMDSFIGLSYDHLPYHLKACFVYFGMFPEDHEIPAWKLIRLWIAEGFIQQQEGMSLEDVAEEYLQDLVNKNLVMVGRVGSNGKIKTCRIHDMLHEFCKREAAEDKFFAEVKGFDRGPHASEKYRRLCIHSRVLDYIGAKPVGRRVRSFLCFASEETVVPLELISSFTGGFKLLRVFDVKSLIFTRFPTDLVQIVHLRYLVLSSDFKVLPSSFSSLWNLQTLVIETSSRTLEVKANLWKMIQLRHVKVNASTKLSSPANESRKGSTSGMTLQTLSTVAPESCTEHLFAARSHNLRVLGIRGHLAKLAFDGLGKLAFLENLKLLNDVFPRPPSEGRLSGLPQKYKFPPKLKKLTLSNTLLDWRDMSILGMLETLEVLKLKDNAFNGSWWEPEEGGFRSLRVLHVGKTDLVTWNASGQHFPRLRQLFLGHCGSLDGVPLGFADISSLKSVELYCSSGSAVSSARTIQERKRSRGEQGSSGFKLSIYPPDQ